MSLKSMMKVLSKPLWFFSLMTAIGLCYTFCLGRAIDFSNPSGKFGFTSDTLLYRADSDISPDQIEELLQYEDITIITTHAEQPVTVYDPAFYFLNHSYFVQVDNSIPYFSRNDYQNGTLKTINIGPEIYRTESDENGTEKLSEIDCVLLSDEGIKEISNLYSSGVSNDSLIYVSSENERVRKDIENIFNNLPVEPLNFPVLPPSLKTIIQNTFVRKKSALVFGQMMSLILLLSISVITAATETQGMGTDSAQKEEFPGGTLCQAYLWALGLQFTLSAVLFRNAFSLYYSIVLGVLWLFVIILSWLVSYLLKTLVSRQFSRKLLYCVDGGIAGLNLFTVLLIIEDCCISLTYRNPGEVRFILLTVLPICILSILLLSLYVRNRLNTLIPGYFRFGISLFTESGFTVLLFAAITSIPLFGVTQALLTGAGSVLLLLLVVMQTGVPKNQKSPAIAKTIRGGDFRD